MMDQTTLDHIKETARTSASREEALDYLRSKLSFASRKAADAHDELMVIITMYRKMINEVDRARKERAAIRDAEERQRRQDMTDEREIEYYTNEAKLGLDLIKDELMVIITMYRKMINEEEI